MPSSSAHTSPARDGPAHAAFNHATLERIQQGDFSPLLVLADAPDALADAPPMVRHQVYGVCLSVVADSRGVLSSGSGVKPESAKALRALSALMRSQSEVGSELRQLLRSSGADEVRRLKLHRHITSQKEDVRPAALEFAVYATELLRARAVDLLVDTPSGSISQAIEAQRLRMQQDRVAASRTSPPSAEAATQQRQRSRTANNNNNTNAAAAAAATSGPPAAPPRARAGTTATGAPPMPVGRLTLPSRPSTRPPATNPLYSSDLQLPHQAAPSAAAAATAGRATSPAAGEDVTAPSAGTTAAAAPGDAGITVSPAMEDAGSGAGAEFPASAPEPEAPPVPDLIAITSPSAVTFFAKHFGVGCVPSLPEAKHMPEHHALVSSNLNDPRSASAAAAATGNPAPNNVAGSAATTGAKVIPTRQDVSLTTVLAAMLVSRGEAVGWGTAQAGELGPAAQSLAAPSLLGGAVPPIPLRLELPLPPAAPLEPASSRPGRRGRHDIQPVVDDDAPRRIPPVPIAAALGHQYTTWLLLNGTVASHGNGEWGQLGVGALESASSPSPTNINAGAQGAPPTLQSPTSPPNHIVAKPRLVTRPSRSGDPHVRVHAGFAYAGALTGKGDICLWGNNNHGQCSVGANVSEANAKLFSPIKISLRSTPLIDLAAGSFFVVGLTASRSVISWGLLGMLGIGTEDEAIDLIPDARRSISVSRTEKPITTTPVRVTTLDRKQIFAVAAGQWHALAISVTGALYTWGVGHQGRLGHGDHETVFVPKLVEALRGHSVVRAACGSFHTVCLTSTGVLFAFGDNAAGQCAQIGHPSVLLPQRVPTQPGLVFIDVACGREHTLALTSEGDLWAFGTGAGTGFVGRRPMSYVPRPILSRRCALHAASGVGHAVAVTIPRTLVLLALGQIGHVHGHTPDDRVAKVLHTTSDGDSPPVTSVAAGSGFMLFADEVGAVRAVGSGDWGQLGLASVSPDRNRGGAGGGGGGGASTLVVSTPELVAAGLPSGSPVVHVAAGFAFSFALTSNGRVYAWGNNNHGQCALGIATPKAPTPTLVHALSFPPPPPTAATATAKELPSVRAPVVQIACGSFFGICLTSDGYVYAWGHTDCVGVSASDIANVGSVVDMANAQAAEVRGSLQQQRAEPDGTSPQAAAASQSAATTPPPQQSSTSPVSPAPQLAAEDVLVASHTAERRQVLVRPLRVPNLSNIVTIAAGQWHAAAIDAAGNVFTWGLGHQGRLGHSGGANSNRSGPVKITIRGPSSAAAPMFVKVACGSFNTAAVTSTGALYTWGDNEHGQCGFTNPLVQTDRPVLVRESGVVDVSLGRHHLVVIDDKKECHIAGRLPLDGAGAGGNSSDAAPIVLSSPELVSLRQLLESNPFVAAAYTSAIQVAAESMSGTADGEARRQRNAVHGTPKFLAAVCGAHHVALTVEYFRPKAAAVHAAVKELRRLSSVEIAPPGADMNADEGSRGATSTVPQQRPRSRTAAAVGQQPQPQQQRGDPPLRQQPARHRDPTQAEVDADPAWEGL